MFRALLPNTTWHATNTMSWVPHQRQFAVRPCNARGAAAVSYHFPFPLLDLHAQPGGQHTS